MDINKLNFSIFEARLFCAMYKLGSTNEVAKALEITPSLVSIGINRLEKKLETDKLFRKLPKTGKYVPTQSAEEIIHPMRYVIQFAEQTIAKKSRSQKSVTVTSNHTILHYYLGPYIKDVLEENPDYQINFRQLDKVDPKNLEINEIGLTFQIENTSNKKFLPYHSFKQKLWASPEYIKKNGFPENIEDLKNHILLMRKHLDQPKYFFGSNFIRSQLSEDEKLRYYNILSTSLIDDLCQSGCGIMAGAEETVKLANFKVENVFPDFKGDEVDVYICIDKEFLDTDLCRKIVNWIYWCRDKAFKKKSIKPIYPFKPLD